MYKKIIFIALPKQDLIRPPGAIPILAAACEEHNIDYEVADFNLWLYRNLDLPTWHQINDNWDTVNPMAASNKSYYKTFISKLNEFVELVQAQSSDLISISVFSDNGSVCALELIERLNKNKNFDIVIGGTGIRARMPTLNGQELCVALLEQKKIDYYIFGEGEIGFRRILSKQVDYPGINNFDAEQIKNLDEFPFPSYLKINPYDYNYVGHPEVIVTGSRGCVRKCTYCDVAKYWPKFRYRSGKRIANELYHYYKSVGIKHFEFSDSLINGSLKQFKEMNLAILDLQKQDPDFKISYKGQFICRNAAQMKEIDYVNMKNAGGDYIYVGVESFSDHVRYDMDKKFNNVDIDHHLRLCGRYGIANSFLMLVGYPTETIEDHKQNLETLVKYQNYAQAGIIEMIVFGYTAGILEDTPLFHMQEQLSIVPEFIAGVDLKEVNWVSLNNPTLTLKERIRRWVELIELASLLGYRMPRNQQYISKFIDLLERTKDKKPALRITINS
jgi:hypothetical protein